MRLRQLPNGSWIDPSRIVAVAAWLGQDFPPQSGIEPIPPRVSVQFVCDSRETISCQTLNEAQRLRDEIAGWANEAPRAGAFPFTTPDIVLAREDR